MTDLIVVGIDGAGFHLLERWLDDETLPTLSGLAAGGGAAKLRSSLPPVTCPAWRCYSTGVNPGKHGVFWWENVDRAGRSFKVPTSGDFAAPDVWDYLGEDGHRSAVINMPTTFPPEELDGWMVSGGGGVDGREYTYPPELRSELERRFGYSVFIPGSSRNIGDDPERVEQVLDVVDQRFAVAEYLREEYDPSFISLTIFYSNVFHHFFWDDDVTKRLWRHIDQRLGEFLDGENVLVMSDHGSNPIHHVFNINAWLEDEGYLVTTGTVSDTLYEAGLTRNRITSAVERVGLKNALKRALPRSVVSRFPNDDGTVVEQGKADKIDWAASTAMASGQGPVYVLVGDPAERQRVRKELREKLAAVRTPDGDPVAREVMTGEEAYEGPFVEEGPDLVLDQADNVQISGSIGADSHFEAPGNWVAENHRDGVLFAGGPDIDPDVSFDSQPTIYDLAPTILHWFGQAVPERMDGRVLTELFDPDSEPGRRAVRTADRTVSGDQLSVGTENQEELRERLRDLGYLSE
jgi:predicted AlkP superfamily phosphohydrolase/phosphomutase